MRKAPLKIVTAVTVALLGSSLTSCVTDTAQRVVGGVKAVKAGVTAYNDHRSGYDRQPIRSNSMQFPQGYGTATQQPVVYVVTQPGATPASNSGFAVTTSGAFGPWVPLNETSF